MFEKYAIISFLDSLFCQDSKWDCIVEEIKTNFSHFFDLKIENENVINWESILESPMMTLTNPEYRKQEFNLEKICSKILKL